MSSPHSDARNPEGPLRDPAQRPKNTPGPAWVDPALVPARHRPEGYGPRPDPFKDPLGYYRTRSAPDAAQLERGRQLALAGDPLADAYVALYPKLGYAKARALLDAALDRGIDKVEGAPEPLRALFARLDGAPPWLSRKRLERGAAVMRRYAPLSWLFMRIAFSQTYVNANRGMPLYLTGSLGPQTVARRLKETSRWRMEIQQPGALGRFGAGFKTTVRVRILHALVRYHLLQHPQWDTEALGMPIPQLDMAGANIGMCLVHGYALRFHGARISKDEMEAVVHLWRYHGHVIGVEEDLNPASSKELWRIGRLIDAATRFRFDARARELTQATLNAPLREGRGLWGRVLDAIDVRASHGYFYFASGGAMYRKMALDPRKRWLWFAPALFPWVFAADSARKYTPGGSALAAELGRRYFKRALGEDEVKNAAFNPYPRPEPAMN